MTLMKTIQKTLPHLAYYIDVCEADAPRTWPEAGGRGILFNSSRFKVAETEGVRVKNI